MARGYDMDRFDLTDDAHALDALYCVVRSTAPVPFTSRGMGQGAPMANPYPRFYFGPVDSSGVDICPMPPAGP